MEQWQIIGSKADECSFTCVIENALLQLKTGQVIRSSNFDFEKIGSKWGIQLTPSPSAQHVRVCVILGSVDVDVYAECSVSILDWNGLKNKTLNMPMRCFNAKEYFKYFDESLPMEYLRTKPELLPNGKLTVLCTVSQLVRTGNIVGKEKMIHKPRLSIPDCTLMDQLGTLLQDGKHSDMVVAVGDQEIKAHKNILALRSPVFAAMLDCPMVESLQNRVVITDCDYDVVKEMLHYIYTGKAPNVTKMAERLLMAADKYALDTLKAMCEKALCETLSVETAMRLLTVAEMYIAHQLKDITNDFIKANLSNVMSTADCKDLIAERGMQLYSK